MSYGGSSQLSLHYFRYFVISVTGTVAQGPLMVTWGDRTPAPSPDYLFVIFSAKKEDQALQFANEARHQVTTRGLFLLVRSLGL